MRAHAIALTRTWLLAQALGVSVASAQSSECPTWIGGETPARYPAEVFFAGRADGKTIDSAVRAAQLELVGQISTSYSGSTTTTTRVDGTAVDQAATTHQTVEVPKTDVDGVQIVARCPTAGGFVAAVVLSKARARESAASRLASVRADLGRHWRRAVQAEAEARWLVALSALRGGAARAERDETTWRVARALGVAPPSGEVPVEPARWREHAQRVAARVGLRRLEVRVGPPPGAAAMRVRVDADDMRPIVIAAFSRLGIERHRARADALDVRVEVTIEARESRFAVAAHDIELELTVFAADGRTLGKYRGGPWPTRAFADSQAARRAVLEVLTDDRWFEAITGAVDGVSSAP